MKSKTSYSLALCLFLMVGNLSYVHAVTDAELETLEKQLEQQEVEEKEKAEIERKTKVEAERKAKERKRLVEEQKRLEEEKRRLEAERKKFEEARQAELNRKRQVGAAKKKAEQEKKEKYNSLIAEAEHAISNKDKEVAISKYNEALVLVPGDIDAITGLKNAEKLMNKVCYEFIGKWETKGLLGGSMIRIAENGYIYFGVSNSNSAYWKCISDKRLIRDSKFGANFEINESATCLYAIDWDGKECYEKVDDNP